MQPVELGAVERHRRPGRSGRTPGRASASCSRTSASSRTSPWTMLRIVGMPSRRQRGSVAAEPTSLKTRTAPGRRSRHEPGQPPVEPCRPACASSAFERLRSAGERGPRAAATRSTLGTAETRPAGISGSCRLSRTLSQPGESARSQAPGQRGQPPVGVVVGRGHEAIEQPRPVQADHGLIRGRAGVRAGDQHRLLASRRVSIAASIFLDPFSAILDAVHGCRSAARKRLGVFLAPGQLQVVLDHHLDQALEVDLGLPAQDLPGLGRVAQQDVDLRGPGVPRVELDEVAVVEVERARRRARGARGPSGSRRWRRRSRRACPAGASATWPGRSRRRSPSRAWRRGCP